MNTIEIMQVTEQRHFYGITTTYMVDSLKTVEVQKRISLEFERLN